MKHQILKLIRKILYSLDKKFEMGDYRFRVDGVRIKPTRTHIIFTFPRTENCSETVRSISRETFNKIVFDVKNYYKNYEKNNSGNAN